jgi:beta-lactamase regulating signal transducer with metallopeptidase domain
MHLISDTILKAICWTLLHSLWQGLLLALVAGAIMVMTKKASSALRYNLLCSLLLFFLATSGYTFYRQLHVSPTASLALNHTPTPSLAEAARNSAPQSTQNTAHTLQNGVDTLVQYFNAHASVVVVIWFIVFMARFVKIMSGFVYAQRVRHYQTSPAPADWQERLIQLLHKLQIIRPVSLLESALIKIPMVVGVLKPVVLVPVGMLTHISPDQVESILLHELAHIRRQDYLFNLIQHLVDTLFFFNPALVWVSSLIRGERENCCDDIAINETRSRRQLISALVSFHEYTQASKGFALQFAGKENQVVKRVKRIAHKKNHSLNAGERIVLMSSILVLSAAFITTRGNRPEPSPAPATVSRPATTKTPTAQPKPTTTPVVYTTPINSQKVPPAAIKSAPPAPAPRDTTPHTDTTDPFAHISVDKLIECKEHGVTPEFITSLKKMGYTDVTPDDAIRLVDHGVSLEFITDLKALGYTGISLNKAVEAVDHGVNVAFIKRIRQLGFADLSLSKAIELVDHGVTSDFIAAWQKRTSTHLDLNDYIKLREAGINPSGQ